MFVHGGLSITSLFYNGLIDENKPKQELPCSFTSSYNGKLEDDVGETYDDQCLFMVVLA